jgi:hypothetical protein
VESIRHFLRGYWPWILLPSVLLGLLWLAAQLSASSGDAPGSYAIM